jgi:hypothetical protein
MDSTEYNEKEKEKIRLDGLTEEQKEIEKIVKEYITNLYDNKNKFEYKRKLQIKKFIIEIFSKIYNTKDKLTDDKIENINKLYKFILFSNIDFLDLEN